MLEITKNEDLISKSQELIGLCVLHAQGYIMLNEPEEHSLNSSQNVTILYQQTYNFFFAIDTQGRIRKLFETKNEN